MMKDVLDIARYIDDGGGLFLSSEEEFRVWLANVNELLRPFGLYIDESDFQTNSNFTNLLDIKYCFDREGNLQTDLYTKETDSRAYLNFSSAHPNHTFSGNVYSQSLRLRRIINCDERLKLRLQELSESFKKAGYPSTMVEEITNKVLNSRRDISVKQGKEREVSEQVIVVSTYKADENIVEAVRQSEENFRKTESFRDQRGPLFKYVKKVGQNLRSHVNTLKHQALGIKRGGATRCEGRGCKTCSMLIKSPVVEIRGKKIALSQGTCKTYNTCYLARCKICQKPYTGRTVEALHKRTCGHRHCYKEVIKRAANGTLQDLDTTNDLYTLGLHLYYDHGFADPDDFDRNMEFGILEVVSPADIEVKEYRWMHRLNSFQPAGINIEYPFGIPLLGQN